MNLDYATVDLLALPAALLADAKNHMNVEHGRDDAYIAQLLGRAIDHFQNLLGIVINPATVRWRPDAADFRDGKALSPVVPINALAAAADAGDVTAGYSFESRSLNGAPACYIVGAWQSGLEFTIDTGYAAQVLPIGATAVPFGLINIIMMLTTHFYEHREIYVNAGTSVLPPFIADVESLWWVPRV